MVANAALIIWPIVVFVLFSKKEPAIALIASIIFGYLLLPTQIGYDLPLLPELDKTSIPSIAALLATFIVLAPSQQRQVPALTNDALPGLFPRSGLGISFLGLFIVSAFLTTLTNSDPIGVGSRFIPGLRPYDAFSAVLTTFITLIPALLARKYLATEDAHRKLLYMLLIAGFAYSFLALFEVRMSPQLNRLVYGFFPHSWVQHLRSGGFRPLVFLEHGLWLGIFFACVVIAAVGCLRIVTKDYLPKVIFLVVWMSFTLVLSKTLGALAITIMLAPAAFFLSVRLQLVLAATLGIILVTYPVLRGAGYIPVDQIVERAEAISPERAASLEFRLRNEDLLLEKANQRPTFGWGAWGRARVFSEDGRDLTVTDGRWVIVIGEGGWLGYIAEFGLLTMPIFFLAFRRKHYGVGVPSSILSLVLVGNLLDLIPNASVSPVTWLMAGAILGRLELKVGVQDEEAESEHGSVAHSDGLAAVPEGSRYTRAANSFSRQSPKPKLR